MPAIAEIIGISTATGEIASADMIEDYAPLAAYPFNAMNGLSDGERDRMRASMGRAEIGPPGAFWSGVAECQWAYALAYMAGRWDPVRGDAVFRVVMGE